MENSNPSLSESISESEPLIRKSSSTLKTKGNPQNKFFRFCLTVFPILQWLPKYNLNWLQHDIIAGLTVGLTVLPQGLAYAQIADLPLQYGLYTSFMGGFIYCFLGTSKDITLGPTAIMSLFVRTHGQGDVVQVIVLTLLGGCIQFVMGVCRLGFIMRYLSLPVVSGFTSAAAITIGFGQVKHLLGIKIDSTEYFVDEVIETFKHISATNGWDVLMGLTCLFLLISLKFLNKHVQKFSSDTKLKKIAIHFLWFVTTARNAIIVLFSAAVAYAIHTQHLKGCKIADCITLTGPIAKGLPPFKAPSFSETNGNVTTTAGELVSNIGVGLIVVPLMGFLESIAIGKSFARKDNYILDVNQEMIAIGVSNIFSSFVSSYTITGSFSRTAINNQSKVKTPAGGIFTGLLVILGLCFLTPVFYYIPKAALAAVIISAVAFMIDYQTVGKLWQVKKLDLLPLIVTFLVCFWYIPYGIIAGVVVSLVLLLYPVSFPGINFTFIHTPFEDDSQKLLVVKIESGLNFSCAEYISNKLKKEVHAQCEPISNILMDFKHVTSIDYTSAQAISELATDLCHLKVQLVIADARPSVQESLVNAVDPGLIHFYTDLTEAISDC